MEEKMREENQEMAGVFLEKDYSEIKKLTERAKTRNTIKNSKFSCHSQRVLCER